MLWYKHGCFDGNTPIDGLQGWFLITKWRVRVCFMIFLTHHIGLMDGYHVTGVTTILYPWRGVINNIVSKDDNSYRIVSSYILQCTCLNFAKTYYVTLGRKVRNVLQTCLLYIHGYVQGGLVTTATSSFTSPTYSYNEVMCLLELAGFVEDKLSLSGAFMHVFENDNLWHDMKTNIWGWLAIV